MAKPLFFVGNLCWSYLVVLGAITKQNKFTRKCEMLLFVEGLLRRNIPTQVGDSALIF